MGSFEEAMTENKNQRIALKAEMQRAKHIDEDEDFVEFIVELTHNLGQVIKFNRSSNSDVPQRVLGTSQNIRN